MRIVLSAIGTVLFAFAAIASPLHIAVGDIDKSFSAEKTPDGVEVVVVSENSLYVFKNDRSLHENYPVVFNNEDIISSPCVFDINGSGESKIYLVTKDASANYKLYTIGKSGKTEPPSVKTLTYPVGSDITIRRVYTAPALILPDDNGGINIYTSDMSSLLKAHVVSSGDQVFVNTADVNDDGIEEIFASSINGVVDALKYDTSTLDFIRMSGFSVTKAGKKFYAPVAYSDDGYGRIVCAVDYDGAVFLIDAANGSERASFSIPLAVGEHIQSPAAIVNADTDADNELIFSTTYGNIFVYKKSGALLVSAAELATLCANTRAGISINGDEKIALAQSICGADISLLKDFAIDEHVLEQWGETKHSLSFKVADITPADDKIFSPNNDSKRDTAPLTFTVYKEVADKTVIKTWLKIYDTGKNLVYTSETDYAEGIRAKEVFEWNGRNTSGVLVPEGVYTYAYHAESKYNFEAKEVKGKVIVDNAPPELSVNVIEPLFVGETGVPNTFPKNTTIRCAVADKQERIKTIEVKIYERMDVARTTPLRTLLLKDVALSYNAQSAQFEGTYDIVWDGKDDNGIYLEKGAYTFSAQAVDAAENIAQLPGSSVSFLFNGVIGIRLDDTGIRTVPYIIEDNRAAYLDFNIINDFIQKYEDVVSLIDQDAAFQNIAKVNLSVRARGSYYDPVQKKKIEVVVDLLAIPGMNLLDALDNVPTLIPGCTISYTFKPKSGGDPAQTHCTVSWNGKYADGNTVPPATYFLEVTLTDMFGNTYKNSASCIVQRMKPEITDVESLGNGYYAIRGKAVREDGFNGFTVSYSKDGGAWCAIPVAPKLQSKADATIGIVPVTGESATGVSGGVLAMWDTFGLSDGSYKLRLTMRGAPDNVYDLTLDNDDLDFSKVFVRNLKSDFDVITPNSDGIKDSTRLSFNLSASVTDMKLVLSKDGVTIGNISLPGIIPAGNTTMTFTGNYDDGVLADGTYKIIPSAATITVDQNTYITIKVFKGVSTGSVTLDSIVDGNGIVNTQQGYFYSWKTKANGIQRPKLHVDWTIDLRARQPVNIYPTIPIDVNVIEHYDKIDLSKISVESTIDGQFAKYFDYLTIVEIAGLGGCIAATIWAPKEWAVACWVVWAAGFTSGYNTFPCKVWGDSFSKSVTVFPFAENGLSTINSSQFYGTIINTQKEYKLQDFNPQAGQDYFWNETHAIFNSIYGGELFQAGAINSSFKCSYTTETLYCSKDQVYKSIWMPIKLNVNEGMKDFYDLKANVIGAQCSHQYNNGNTLQLSRLKEQYTTYNDFLVANSRSFNMSSLSFNTKFYRYFGDYSKYRTGQQEINFNSSTPDAYNNIKLYKPTSDSYESPIFGMNCPYVQIDENGQRIIKMYSTYSYQDDIPWPVKSADDLVRFAPYARYDDILAVQNNEFSITSDVYMNIDGEPTRQNGALSIPSMRNYLVSEKGALFPADLTHLKAYPSIKDIKVMDADGNIVRSLADDPSLSGYVQLSFTPVYETSSIDLTYKYEKDYIVKIDSLLQESWNTTVYSGIDFIPLDQANKSKSIASDAYGDGRKVLGYSKPVDVINFTYKDLEVNDLNGNKNNNISFDSIDSTFNVKVVRTGDGKDARKAVAIHGFIVLPQFQYYTVEIASLASDSSVVRVDKMRISDEKDRQRTTVLRANGEFLSYVDITDYNDGKYKLILTAVGSDSVIEKTLDFTIGSPITIADASIKANGSAITAAFDPLENNTTIEFTLNEDSKIIGADEGMHIDIKNGAVVLRSFSLDGQAGLNKIVWDGKDNSGVLLPDGIYTLDIKADNQDNLSFVDSGSLSAEVSKSFSLVNKPYQVVDIAVCPMVITPADVSIGKDKSKITFSLNKKLPDDHDAEVTLVDIGDNAIRKLIGGKERGNNTVVWEGLKDDLTIAPNGDYKVKVSLKQGVSEINTLQKCVISCASAQIANNLVATVDTKVADGKDGALDNVIPGDNGAYFQWKAKAKGQKANKIPFALSIRASGIKDFNIPFTWSASANISYSWTWHVDTQKTIEHRDKASSDFYSTHAQTAYIYEMDGNASEGTAALVAGGTYRFSDEGVFSGDCGVLHHWTLYQIAPVHNTIGGNCISWGKWIKLVYYSRANYSEEKTLTPTKISGQYKIQYEGKNVGYKVYDVSSGIPVSVANNFINYGAYGDYRDWGVSLTTTPAGGLDSGPTIYDGGYFIADLQPNTSSVAFNRSDPIGFSVMLAGDHSWKQDSFVTWSHSVSPLSNPKDRRLKLFSSGGDGLVTRSSDEDGTVFIDTLEVNSSTPNLSFSIVELDSNNPSGNIVQSYGPSMTLNGSTDPRRDRLFIEVMPTAPAVAWSSDSDVDDANHYLANASGYFKGDEVVIPYPDEPTPKEVRSLKLFKDNINKDGKNPYDPEADITGQSSVIQINSVDMDVERYQDGVLKTVAQVRDNIITKAGSVSFVTGNNTAPLAIGASLLNDPTYTDSVVKLKTLNLFLNETYEKKYVEVQGVADASAGGTFKQYTLEYGQGAFPSEWYPISSSTSPVKSPDGINGGLLGRWDITPLSGVYTLLLTVVGTDMKTKTVKHTITIGTGIDGSQFATVFSPYKKSSITFSSKSLVTGDEVYVKNGAGNVIDELVYGNYENAGVPEGNYFGNTYSDEELQSAKAVSIERKRLGDEAGVATPNQENIKASFAIRTENVPGDIVPGNTLGDKTVVNPGHLVINEVYWGRDTFAANGSDYSWVKYAQYIEIYNPTSSMIDISGYTIGDSEGEGQIPNGQVIAANGYYVVARNANAFKERFGFYPNVEWDPMQYDNNNNTSVPDLISFNTSRPVISIELDKRGAEVVSIIPKLESETVQLPQSDLLMVDDFIYDFKPDGMRFSQLNTPVFSYYGTISDLPADMDPAYIRIGYVNDNKEVEMLDSYVTIDREKGKFRVNAELKHFSEYVVFGSAKKPEAPILNPTPPAISIPRTTVRGTANPLMDLVVTVNSNRFLTNTITDTGSFELRDILLNPGRNDIVLRSVNKIGQISEPAIASIVVDKEAPFINTSAVSGSPFSPNNDNVRESARIGVDFSEPVYARLQLIDSTGIVKNITSGDEMTLQSQYAFIIDKSIAAIEGKYSFTIFAQDQAGNLLSENQYSRGSVIVDTTAPTVTLVKISEKTISPNGDGRKEYTSIEYSISDNMSQVLSASLSIRDLNGSVLLIPNTNDFSRTQTFIWDGKDIGGNTVADGEYSVVCTVRDSAGNSAERALTSIKVDTVPIKQIQNIVLVKSCIQRRAPIVVSYTVPESGALTILVRDKNNKVAATLRQALQIMAGSYSESFTQGLPEGTYFLSFEITDGEDVAAITAVPFTVDGTPPVIVLNDQFLSQKNSGYIVLNGTISDSAIDTISIAYKKITESDDAYRALSTLTGQVFENADVYVWNVASLAGTYMLKIHAMDKAGNSTTIRFAPVTIEQGVPRNIVFDKQLFKVNGNSYLGFNAQSDLIGTARIMDAGNTVSQISERRYSIGGGSTYVDFSAPGLSPIINGDLSLAITSERASYISGVLLWLPMNGNVSDYSGNNSLPIANNTQPTDNRFGQSGGALSFDGTSSFISLPDIPQQNNGFTIASWIYLNAQGETVLFADSDGMTNDGTVIITVGGIDNKVRFTLHGENGTRSLSVPGTLPLNTWTFISATYTGTSMIVFIDGVEAARLSTETMVAHPFMPSRAAYIGKTAYGMNFNGRIDDFRLFGRSVGTDELNALYCDSLNNRQITESASISVDRILPTIVIASPQPSSTITGDLTITGSIFDENLSRYVVRRAMGSEMVDYADGSSVLNGSAIVSIPNEMLNRSEKFEIQAYDSYGNSRTETVAVNISKNIPVMTLINPLTTVYTKRYGTILANVQNTTAGKLYWSSKGNGGSVSEVPNSHVLLGINTYQIDLLSLGADGEYSIFVGDNNVTSARATYILDTKTPECNIQFVQNGLGCSLLGQAQDANFDIAILYIEKNGVYNEYARYTSGLNNYLLAMFTPNNQEETIRAKLVVRDKAGNEQTCYAEYLMQRPTIAFTNPSEGKTYQAALSCTMRATHYNSAWKYDVTLSNATRGATVVRSGALSDFADGVYSALINASALNDGAYVLGVNMFDADHSAVLASDNVAITLDTKISIDNPIVTINSAVGTPIGTIVEARYGISEQLSVSTSILDAANEHVRSFKTNALVSPGAFREIWDGKNDRNEYVTRGMYFYAINIVDNAGNTASYVKQLDMVPPVVSIYAVGNVYTNAIGKIYVANSAQIVLNAYENDYYYNSGIKSVTYSWDDIDYQTYANPFDLTSFAEGTYALIGKVDDNAQLTSGNTAYQFTIDNTPPQSHILFSSAPMQIDGAVCYPRNTKVNFTSADSASGVRTIFYQVNDGALNVYSIETTLVTDGDYVIRWYSVDNVGNIEQFQTSTFRIRPFDTTPPVSTLTPPIQPISIDGKLYLSGAALYSISAVDLLNEHDGIASGVDRISYSIDSGSVLEYGNPFGLSEGNRTITFSSIDKAGNKEQDKAYQISIDSSAPITAMSLIRQNKTNAASDVNYVMDEPVSFMLISADPVKNDVSTGVKRIEYKLPIGNWSMYSATVALSDIRNEPYIISIRGVDNVENTELVKTVTIIKDSIPPVITVNNIVSGGYYKPGVAASFTVVEANLSAIYATLDGNLYLSGTPIVTEGAHTLVVTAVDKAGNQDSKTITITVDGTIPVVSIANVTSGGFYKAGIAPTFTASDLNLFAVNATLNGATFTSGTPIPTDGSYSLQVTAVDKANNSATQAVPFTVDGTPPTITISGVSNGAFYLAPVSAQVAISDLNIATSSISLNGNPYVSGTLIAGEGQRTIIATAQDKAGNESTKTVTFGIDTQAPRITITGAVDGGFYRPTLNIFYTAEDVNLISLSAKLDKKNYISGDPITKDGEHTLTVTAKDKFGRVTTKTITFTIDSKEPIVVVAGVSDGKYYRHSVMPIVVIHDENISNKTITLNGDPYTPKTWVKADGNYTLVADAVDKAGNRKTVTVIFVIDKMDPIIAISGVADNVSYTNAVMPVITVTDENFDWSKTIIVNCGKEDHRKHNCHDRHCGDAFVSGTTITNDGTYLLIVFAKDKADNSAMKSVSFSVDTQSPIITISGISDGGYYKPYTAVSFFANDVNLVSCTATMDGVAYMSGTPIKNNGVHTFVVKAIDKAGHVAIKPVTFTIDGIQPIVSVTGIDNGGYYAPGIAPNVNIIDLNLLSTTATLDNVSYTSGTAITAEGAHTLYAYGVDRAGNFATKTIKFTIDGTTPAITINGAENNGVYNRTVTVDVSVYDANLKRTYITLDNVPTSSRIVVSGEGTHTIHVEADDKAGNRSMKDITFVIDKTLPVVLVEGVANNGTYTKAIIGVKLYEDNYDAARTSFKLDSQEYAQAITNGVDSGGERFYGLSIANITNTGAHTLAYSVSDKAGNKVTGSIAFTISPFDMNSDRSFYANFDSSTKATYAKGDKDDYSGVKVIVSGGYMTNCVAPGITSGDLVVQYKAQNNMRMDKGTFAMWVKPNWTKPTNSSIVSFGISSLSKLPLAIYATKTNETILSVSGKNNSAKSITATTNWAVNRDWTYIGFTWSSEAKEHGASEVTLSFFINGTVVGTLTMHDPVFDDIYWMLLGYGKPDKSWTTFTGKLDEARVYEKAFSADEVKALFEAEKARGSAQMGGGGARPMGQSMQGAMPDRTVSEERSGLGDLSVQ